MVGWEMNLTVHDAAGGGKSPINVKAETPYPPYVLHPRTKIFTFFL